MPKKAKDIQYYEATGRRKESVARVRLYITSKKSTAKTDAVKAGEIIVNKKPLNEYFQTIVLQRQAGLPFRLTNNEDRFATTIKVMGGGIQGQVEAIVHGISRALCLASAEYRPVLKQGGLLTRDARTRERRKVGMGGKARRKRQSPKR